MRNYPFYLAAILLVFATTTLAQSPNEKSDESLFKPKVSINAISHLNYAVTEKNGNVSNSFNHVRTYGYFILDFNSKLQSTFLFIANPADRQYMHEAFLSYDFRKEFKIDAGLKRTPISFLNQISPTLLETASTPEILSQMLGGDVDIVSGVNSGRDLGVEVKGELFPSNDRYSFFEYYIGAFNGTGVGQVKDNNNGKDFVGRLVVQPIKDLRFTVGGLMGQRGSKIVENDLSMRKMITFGAWYNYKKLSARAEYIWATNAPTKKEGGYIMTQYAFNKKWSLVGQIETYKNERLNISDIDNYNYIVAANYWFYKRCRLQFQVAHKRENGTPVNTALTQLQIVF